METLKVLMWKHLMVRARRFIHTPVEILSPIIFFTLLYIYKDQMNPVPKSHKLANSSIIQQTEPISLDHTIVPPRILYTPDTFLTGLLMESVGDKLKVKRLQYLPNRATRGYYPFSNDTITADYIKDMLHDDAIVIFQDMLGDTWPKKLNYTIRMKTDFLTHQYESLDSTVGPHKRFGSIYEPFMRLQWAIDTSYIELLTDNPINQSVTLQEFPYVKSNENMTIDLICILLMFVCWLSLMLVFVFLMSRLLEERTTGIQELIKMVGVSSNMIGVSHFLNALPAGLVYSVVGTVLLKATANPVVPHSDPLLIFLMLALHFVTVVAMAFACSYLARSTQYAVTLSIFAYVLLWTPTRMTFGQTMNRALVLISGLLPHTPMQWFWDELASLEVYGRGLTWSRIMTSHSPKSGPVFLCYVLLIIQSCFFFLLSWYLELVRPGKYGQALPWNFLFQKQYWSNKKVTPDSLFDDEDQEQPISHDPQYFEDPPRNMEVGIKIVNVSKVFPKQRALTNVSLDVYKGEITILLGHNGAGKTTLMSIITGMLSATEGKVYVNGMDTVTQQKEVRKHLGLCPQHNLFFPDLTILEHVMFFTLLKGGTFRNARKSSMELLEKLGLEEKANNKSSELSGGMKRRLQLACALAGGADVLILDEPTSGLDVETRRELWDLLLSLRGDRTVLLTTHFMEEADALGDRVAALHAGILRCLATTMYLKKAVGTGYRLSFTTIGAPNEPAITSVVTSHVPDTTVKEKTLNSISYNLPAKSSSKFPHLFTALETKRSQLGVDSIGVGASTLDEVFLRLCSDVDTAYMEDDVDTNMPEPAYKKVMGFPLYVRQLSVLLKRQLKYVLSKKITYLTLQVILPIVMICLFTRICNDEKDMPQKNRLTAMDLDIYKDMPERRVLYDDRIGRIDLRALQESYKKVVFEQAPDVAEAVLRAGSKDILEYNKYLVGFELNDTNAKVLYTTTVRHAAPVALNLVSNALASLRVPWAGGRTVTTLNHPLEGEHRAVFADALKQPKSISMVFMWTLFIVFIILATNINAVSLPCKERSTGSRHIHVMSGCAPALHWLATLLFHAAVCLAVLVLPALLAAALLDTDDTLGQPDTIGALLMILLLGSLSFFAFTYLVSFSLNERTASMLLIAVIILFGFITPSMIMASQLLEEAGGFTAHLLSVANFVMPPHTMAMAAFRCVNVARLNALCSLNKQRCPNLIVFDNGFDSKKCCESSSNPRCYFCIDQYAPGKEMIYLTVQFLVYMILVVLTEYGFFNGLYDKLFNANYKPQPQRYNDEMVRAEKAYVEKAITLPKDQITDAMLIHDVHKRYYRILNRSCNAVCGISFSVKKGECFGLLGVNGAGKSTTFKMLTGEECATRGNIFANGHHFKRASGQYLRSLGYCPQFFGLDEFQTGRENLVLLLTLRGFAATDVTAEVDSWIQIVGLEKYSNRSVSGYSGGCVRRLGTAAALCSGAPLTLLDEPTAGVDVAARRRVWAALRRGLRERRSVLITSHSMDEMEALCGRVALLSGGELCALGSPAALRARHAQGHALLLKISSLPAGDETDSSKSALQLLKGELQQKFNCTLKDEHKTMLHYHINETMRYSDLFTAMEQLKATFPTLVEDYAVTETTLEEVFLSFAKDAQEPPTV